MRALLGSRPKSANGSASQYLPGHARECAQSHRASQFGNQAIAACADVGAHSSDVKLTKGCRTPSVTPIAAQQLLRIAVRLTVLVL
jgi:hypothetical protein